MRRQWYYNECVKRGHRSISNDKIGIGRGTWKNKKKIFRISSDNCPVCKKLREENG